MLISREKACLLVVDVQEKLFPLIHEFEKIADNSQWLLSLAQDLSIPIFFSEQYPSGLGKTIPRFKPFINPDLFMEKTHFSCSENEEGMKHLRHLNKPQIIVIGIETHVCILQTVLGLKTQGFDVFVVADAVGARFTYDHDMGLQRMRANGANLVTKEMVFFECLQKAGTEEFKTLSQRYFRKR